MKKENGKRAKKFDDKKRYMGQAELQLSEVHRNRTCVDYNPNQCMTSVVI